MQGNMKGNSVNKGRPMKNSSGSSKNKSKISKRRKRGNFLSKIPGIINYLTSDSYLYSHLIGSSASHHGSGIERNEPILRKKDGESKENLMEYFKSDVYLYAPLGDTKHRDNIVVKSVISSPRVQELQFTRVTSSVLSREIAWQTKQVAKDSIVSRRETGKGGLQDTSVKYPSTPEFPEGKKQARRSSRLPTMSG